MSEHQVGFEQQKDYLRRMTPELHRVRWRHPSILAKTEGLPRELLRLRDPFRDVRLKMSHGLRERHTLIFIAGTGPEPMFVLPSEVVKNKKAPRQSLIASNDHDSAVA